MFAKKTLFKYSVPVSRQHNVMLEHDDGSGWVARSNNPRGGITSLFNEKTRALIFTKPNDVAYNRDKKQLFVKSSVDVIAPASSQSNEQDFGKLYVSKLKSGPLALFTRRNSRPATAEEVAHYNHFILRYVDKEHTPFVA